jgi:schlafen family protein
MAAYPNTDIQELVDRPRESLDIEIKAWLDLNDANQRADLAKAIIAIANHGGGFIVIGFSESDAGNFTTDPNRPPNLNGLSQDAVQDAVQKYLEPPVQCRVSHVSHADGHGQFPVIVIPGGHRTPIKARGGSPDGKLIATRVYIRRPGPRSEEPQSSAEWDHLFERCIRARSTELLDTIRDVLAGVSPQAPPQPGLSAHLQSFTEEAQARWNNRVSVLPIDASPRFPNGYYEASFAIDGEFDHHDLPHFRDVFQTALKNHSGWPPFAYIPKFVAPIDNAIESWIGPLEGGQYDIPAHHDFWRASFNGFFFIRRGYDEDGRYDQCEPGKTFDITTPTWRIGELLLQMSYVATALGAQSANLLMKLNWIGLRERTLVSVGNPNRVFFQRALFLSPRQLFYRTVGSCRTNF